LLCQLCQSKEATVFLIEAINNTQKTLHICEDCAEKKHLNEFMTKPEIAIHGILASIIKLGLASGVKTKTIVCPRCETNYELFRETGRFGCAECYGAFYHLLLPIFRQFHQADSHGSSAETETKKEETQDKDEDLERLRQKLAQAVKSEQFEEAARLRDLLRKKEKESSGS
jgi:protein arginine kinase activator